MAPIFLEAAGSVVGVGVGCRLTNQAARVHIVTSGMTTYLYDHPTGDKEVAGRGLGQQCIISKVTIISEVSLPPAAVSTIFDY